MQTFRRQKIFRSREDFPERAQEFHLLRKRPENSRLMLGNICIVVPYMLNQRQSPKKKLIYGPS